MPGGTGAGTPQADKGEAVKGEAGTEEAGTAAGAGARCGTVNRAAAGGAGGEATGRVGSARRRIRDGHPVRGWRTEPTLRDDDSCGPPYTRP
jgi:hypothetical protein